MQTLQSIRECVNRKESSLSVFYQKKEDSYSRLLYALNGFETLFGGEREVFLCTAPGRTELGGNHTDHQGGHVLAATIDLDMLAVVSPRKDRKVCFKSQGYPIITVSLNNLQPRNAKRPNAGDLLRGVLEGFAKNGMPLQRGFDAFCISNIHKGVGLSSSAAYEILLGKICAKLCGKPQLSEQQIAKIGQYAENVHFQKPCGLMDQMTCAIGGVVEMSFRDISNPQTEKISFDLESTGYRMILVETGDNHAKLAKEYGEIPEEMGQVASYFGKERLCEVQVQQFQQHIGDLRKATSDRAVLRAMHYFQEDIRAMDEAEALRKGDFQEFLRLVQASGDSSAFLLQNIYSVGNPKHQSVTLALAMGKAVLNGKGAIRIHGGGFGGTVQAFVPACIQETFCKSMEQVFGKKCCHILQIRNIGGATIDFE